MVTELIIMIFVSLLCFILGDQLWRKHNIKLVHSYHYQKVAKNDIPAYTAEIGKALVLIGCASLITGILDYVKRKFLINWIFWSICCFIALVILYRAQKKYNGGVF